jgi:hypothetical protein
VVEVRFEEPAQAKLPVFDTWDAILGQEVINYDVARGWRGVQPKATAATLNPPATAPGSFKVEVGADGLYQITYDALKSAGFPLDTMNPEHLHLVAGGEEIAIQVNVGLDGVFTPGDRVLFYGQADRSRYTNVNVYWLYLDGTPGLRMSSRSVTPQDIYVQPSPRWITNRFEENHVYDAVHAEASGDHWYWSRLDRLQTECPDYAETYSFDLPQLSTEAHTAKLRTSVQGYTWNTHNLKVKINGHYIGNIVWEDPLRKDSEFTFPAGWLKSTGNILRLANGACPPPSPPPPPNGMYFSHFTVEHRAGYRAIKDKEGREFLGFWGETGNRQYELEGFSPANLVLYEITDPTSPVILTGAEWTNNLFKFQDETGALRHYLAASDSIVLYPPIYPDKPSNLGSTSKRPDYLLIGYGGFLAATQPLVDLREDQGLEVLKVDVQDVYDEFSYGLLNPEAIRDFLGYIAAKWHPQPDYVLFVGDGTIDFRDYLGRGWHNYLPPLPADVDLHEGPVPAETASDNELDPGIELPFFQMGRLPVASVEQTQAVIAKIVSYETAPLQGLWNRGALFVADDDDIAGSFTDYSDGLYHSLSEPFHGDRIYLASNPSHSHEYGASDPSELEAARAAIRRRFVGGELLISYMGHSSHSQWAHEVLLHRDGVPDLHSGGNLPVVLSMTCYTAAFQFPSYAPLDERLVVEPNGGAVAAWGATGSAVATGHRHLAEGFLDGVQSHDLVSLGAAVHSGYLRLYNKAPTNRDLIDTYVLLGDPAMRLNRFTGTVHYTYLPLASDGQ